jgi:hypothetical protein
MSGGVKEELRRLDERATAGLTARERRHLESALTKIVRNLEPIAPAADEADEVHSGLPGFTNPAATQ